MSKIATKTLSRYKTLFTVLLALLLLVIAAAPVSAAIIVPYGQNGANNFTNLSAGAVDITLDTIRIQSGGPSDISQPAIYITLSSGVTFNTTGSLPSTVVRNSSASDNSNGPGKLVIGSITRTSTDLNIPVTTPSNWTEYINLTGVRLDVSQTATFGSKSIIISTGGSNPTVGLNVTKPRVAFNSTNVTPGAVNIPGGPISVNSTIMHPNGEIGVGFVNVTLPASSGITFSGSATGSATVNTSKLNTNYVGLNVTGVGISSDGLTLYAAVDVASNSSASSVVPTSASADQSVTFSGYYLNVSSTAPVGATNFTVYTRPTGGSWVWNDTANAIYVVKPATGINGTNVTLGGINNPGGAIWVNSSAFHPDGEIGNYTYIRIRLPASSGITFSGSKPGYVVANTSSWNRLNATSVAVSSDGLELNATIDFGSNSTTSQSGAGSGFVGQSVTFSGYGLNVSSTATIGTWNYTVYTQSNTTGLGSWIEQTNTTIGSGITVVKPNITYAGLTVYLAGVENRNITGAAIAINSTPYHPDGEIGNYTYVRIRLPASSGITFNGSAPGYVVANTSSWNRLNATSVAVSSDGLELNATIDCGSNSTTSQGGAGSGFVGQSVTFSGYKLNVSSTATTGVTKFTVYTMSNTTELGPLNSTWISQEIDGVTIQLAVPDTVYPVSPNGIYENPILIPVGTTATFNWTVYSNGSTTRDPYGGKLINFAVNGSSLINTSSMTSSSTGNVSVTFTAPTTVPVGITPQGRYVLNVTPDGYPLVVNTTNIAVVNGTATKMRIFPDITRYAPNGIANVTVWAQDAYGNNQTVNNTVVRMSATESDVTILINSQPLLGGNYTFQVKKSTPGTAHLYVQNDSPTAILPMASGTQSFIGDIGSIRMTSTKSSLVANGEEANLTAQLYDLDGVAMSLSAQNITFTANNVTPAATASITLLSSQTNASGMATAYIKSNAAGLTGTIWANASVTNQSLVVLTSTVPITLTSGTPANQNSTLTASPTSVTAGDTSAISALIRDSTNIVLSGETVNFAITTPGGSLSNSSVVTNTAGYANVTLTTNTTVGTNTVQATSASGNVSRTVSVTTTAGTVSKLGFTSATPSTIGVTLAGTMEVQLQDSNGNSVATAGTTVTFANSNTAAGTLSATSNTTDATGKTNVVLTGSSAGGVTVINASSTGLTSATKTVTVQSVGGITLTASKNLAAANGSDTITLTTQLIDATGAPLTIAGRTIDYSKTGSVTLSSSSGITGATGANVITITSTTPGMPTVTAATSGVPTNTTTVTFSGNATTITATATPASTTVNGLITVNAQAKDASGYNAVIYNGLPITGYSVAFSPSSSAVTVSNASTVFNATGAASATVTSATANTYTMTISGIGTSGTTTVTFTAAPAAATYGVWRAGTFYLNGLTPTQYGLSTDTPLTGDWTGSGTDKVGVWRAGTFYLYGLTPTQYGLSTDTPLVGHWTAGAADTPGVWRAGTFYFGANSSQFGLPTDTPLVGDWTGSGVDTPGVWRAGTFYLGASSIQYGLPTDTPLVWNNNGIDSVGVYRAGTFYFYGVTGSTPFGISGDTPLYGKWS